MTKLFFLFFYEVFHYFFTYIKISKKLSAKYKQQIKQRLQDYKIMLRKYISILLKKKIWQYGCERYKNLSEDEKQKLV